MLGRIKVDLYPVLAASGFGLLHGFGFASVLSELSLPQNLKISALLFFNLGIEIGQIILIASCFLAVLILTKTMPVIEQRDKLLTPGVSLIGVTASYWMFKRFVLNL